MNKKVCFSLLFLLLAGSVRAQWQQVFGPTGEDVEAIASDAGHIYAGTDSGVYVSSNNGMSWSGTLSHGLANQEIFSIAITPAGTVLAGTEGSGIFRTTNSGSTWDTSRAGLPDSSYILSLASDGHGNLYAGHSTQGVFYSSDDGLHWVARNSGIDRQIVFSLAITPSGTIYAGGNGYVFSSTDSGRHWDTSFVARPIAREEVLALAADSFGSVFAGTFLGGRYRLREGSWDTLSSASAILDSEVRALAARGNSVFAGLFGGGILQSTDLGAHWSNFSEGLTDSNIFSLTAAPSGYLFAGTYQAEIFRSNLALAVAGSASLNLFEIWPQPFRDKVNVSFSLAKTEMVQIEIFDALGREVLSLTREGMAVGSHDLTLKLPSLASGVYLVVLRTPSETRQIECACVQ